MCSYTVKYCLRASSNEQKKLFINNQIKHNPLKNNDFYNLDKIHKKLNDLLQSNKKLNNDRRNKHMTPYDFSRFFDVDFGKSMFERAGFNFPFNMKALIEAQRKNMQALTQAQQLAFENAQAIARRQTEILSQLVQDNARIAQEIMAESAPKQKIARQADLICKNYEKSITNWNEISDILGRSSKESADIISRRVTAALNEIRNSFSETEEEETEKPAYKKAA